MTQYLYLVKCQQYHKIGVANDIQSRLAQLSTGNPFELEVVALYGFGNAQAVESAVHQRFSACRRRGEWFELSDKEVSTYHAICEMLGGVRENSTLPNPTIEEVEEAEEIQETEMAEGAKFDYRAMFADGWTMDTAHSGHKNKKYDYWAWRKRKVSGNGYIYGGKISDLPYPSLEEMRRIYRDGES